MTITSGEKAIAQTAPTNNPSADNGYFASPALAELFSVKLEEDNEESFRYQREIQPTKSRFDSSPLDLGNGVDCSG